MRSFSDGVIVAPQSDGSGSIRSLLERGIPTVFVDRTVQGIRVPSVTTDSRQGINQAVRHFAEQGHRRIGYIAGPQSISTGRERHAAFADAMVETGLERPAAVVVPEGTPCAWVRAKSAVTRDTLEARWTNAAPGQYTERSRRVRTKASRMASARMSAITPAKNADCAVDA